MAMSRGHTENSALGLRARDPGVTEARVTKIRIAMAENRYNEELRDHLAEEWGIAPATVSSMATEASRRNRFSSEEQETLVRAHRARVIAALEEDRGELRSIAEEERSSGSNRTAVEALRGSTAALDVQAKILGLGQKGTTVNVALLDQRGEPTKDTMEFVTLVLSCVCDECKVRVLERVKAEAAGDVSEVKGEVVK